MPICTHSLYSTVRLYTTPLHMTASSYVSSSSQELPLSVAVVNCTTLTIFFVTLRKFIYEVRNLLRGDNVLEWAMSPWSWVDIIPWPLFAGICTTKSQDTASILSAILAVLLWTKLLYFMKGFERTGMMVQAVSHRRKKGGRGRSAGASKGCLISPVPLTNAMSLLWLSQCS